MPNQALLADLPPAPSSVAADSTVRQQGIKWVVPADPDLATVVDRRISYFQAQRATDSGFTAVVNDDKPIYSTSKRWPATGGDSHYMRVRSVDDSGNASAWAAVSGPQSPSQDLGAITAGTITGATIRSKVPTPTQVRVEITQSGNDRIMWIYNNGAGVDENRLRVNDTGVHGFVNLLLSSDGAINIDPPAGFQCTVLGDFRTAAGGYMEVGEGTANDGNALKITRTNGANPAAETNRAKIYMVSETGVNKLKCRFPNGTLKIICDDV